jgi:hypothetical protein
MEDSSEAQRPKGSFDPDTGPTQRKCHCRNPLQSRGGVKRNTCKQTEFRKITFANPLNPVGNPD